jgi:hypothetical protein
VNVPKDAYFGVWYFIYYLFFWYKNTII